MEETAVAPVAAPEPVTPATEAAPDAAAGEAAAVEEAPPPPDPKAERAARLNAFAQAKRQELAAKRAMVAERTRVEQLRAQAAAPPEELAWARALREKAKADPVGVLEELGATTEQLVKAAVLRGSPEEKIAQLERKLAEREARESQLEQQRRQLEAERGRAQAFEAFTATARGNESRWEALSALPDDYLQSEGWKIARDAAKRGYTYSDEEILDYLEQREKPRYNKLRERLSVSGTGTTGQRDTAKAAPSKTLSHKQAQTASSTADISRLPRDEQIKALAALYDSVRKSQ
ncbi:MAG: hypothetical protein EBR82_12220 [Caulobacteraceae bacterium]|nr:hypothetical protein [Caulobacteraceae bacterium]